MSFTQSPFNPVSFAVAEKTVRSISSIDPKLSRTNYYDGRLLKASDLIRDQLYLDERLREVGRVLGQGIVKGLDVHLTSDGILRVAPGLAVTPSGRILELEKNNLEINLYNSADIAALNEGFRYFQRGLYAVVIHYAEKGEGSAEIYPRDLEGNRGFHFNAFAEGIEVILVPIRTQFPNRAKQVAERTSGSVFTRSALVRELIVGNRDQIAEMPEDGIALGLISVENGKPEWLDRGLLRRPHREPQARYSLQIDLFNHYEELLQEILTLRQQGTRQNQFPAAHYFEVLPPFGSIPKDCVDPEHGYQGYFPSGFEVSIAPVRQDDVNAILEQSVALEPIDLRADKDVDIIVLVPLSDHDFVWRARQLQHTTSQLIEGETTEDFVLPPHLDEYALRAYGETTHAENTDAAVWREIWSAAQEVFYVRRPTRVAETQVSAIVLATGAYEPLPEGSALPPNVEDLETELDELQEEVSALETENEELRLELTRDPDERLAEANAIIDELNTRIQTLEEQLAIAQEDDAETINLRNQIRQLQIQNQNLTAQVSALQGQLDDALKLIKELQENGNNVFRTIKEILERRPVNDARALEAAEKLHEKIGDDQAALAPINQVLLLLPTTYDALNWPTIAAVEDQKLLGDLLAGLANTTAQTIPGVMVKLLDQFKIDEGLIDEWKKVATKTRNPQPINLDKIAVVGVDRLIPRTQKLPKETVEALTKATAEDELLLKQINQLVAVVDPVYAEPLWIAIPALVESGTLDKFLQFAIESNEKGLPLGVAVGSTTNQFKFNAAMRKTWSDVDLR